MSILVGDLLKEILEVQEAFERKNSREQARIFYFVDLIEEVGELAEVIRAEEFYGVEPEEVLEDEIADIFYSLIGIAKASGINFEKVVINRLKKLRKKAGVRKKIRKLVRDRIPEILESKGVNFKVIQPKGEELREYYIRKVVEEALEFLENPTPEEIADLLEIIDATITKLGIPRQEVERIRKEKAEKRGKFNKGLILEIEEESEGKR